MLHVRYFAGIASVANEWMIHEQMTWANRGKKFPLLHTLSIYIELYILINNHIKTATISLI